LGACAGAADLRESAGNGAVVWAAAFAAAAALGAAFVAGDTCKDGVAFAS